MIFNLPDAYRQTFNTIPLPYQSNSLTYNKTAQAPQWDNYNPEQLIIDGQLSGTNAGTYIALFTPKEGFCWDDLTTSAKQVQWKIEKAESKLRESNIPRIVRISGGREFFHIDVLDGDGDLIISGYDTAVCSKIIATKLSNREAFQIDMWAANTERVGETTVTFSMTETTNYKPVTYPNITKIVLMVMPTYTGEYTSKGDGVSGSIRATTSGTLTIPQDMLITKVEARGGDGLGGLGGKGLGKNRGGGGGGGGYADIFRSSQMTVSQSAVKKGQYPILIGGLGGNTEAPNLPSAHGEGDPEEGSTVYKSGINGKKGEDATSDRGGNGGDGYGGGGGGYPYGRGGKGLDSSANGEDAGLFSSGGGGSPRGGNGGDKNSGDGYAGKNGDKIGYLNIEWSHQIFEY